MKKILVITGVLVVGLALCWRYVNIPGFLKPGMRAKLYAIGSGSSGNLSMPDTKDRYWVLFIYNEENPDLLHVAHVDIDGLEIKLASDKKSEIIIQLAEKKFAIRGISPRYGKAVIYVRNPEDIAAIKESLAQSGTWMKAEPAS